MILGISGWKKSGKDEAASLLVQDFKFKRVSFANVLKDMVSEQYGIPRISLDDQALKEQPILAMPVDPKDAFSIEIARILDGEFKRDELGQKYWTPRALAILEGSVKRSVNSNYWTERALSLIGPGELSVISDLRYKNEASQIRAYADSIGSKSLLIRINRFDESPSTDSSERDLDNYQGFDYIVENRSTLEKFKETIADIVFKNL